jgi:hypothetical protein
MITNHYGHTVDSDKPVTGVLSSNAINWEFVDDEICLTCEEILSDIKNDDTLDDDDKQHEIDMLECQSDHDKIIGDWIKDTDGKYAPDETGEYAAIVRESTIQVIWSKTLTRGALCSPCYPGQADIPSNGDYLAYTLPDYLTSQE